MVKRPSALEEMGLKLKQVNSSFWKGKRVFLTGHTGFKGSWLSIWLQFMGAEVYGLALDPPTKPSLFNEANVSAGMHSSIGDIRDYSLVNASMKYCKPDIIIHMAAQPLVRHSYKEPVDTFSINIMGTVNVLESARDVGTAKAIVNVTTDKCYENKEWIWSYREDEQLGGFDPYSNSKGCSELVTSSYRRSFFQKMGIALASARAGNVIGGGDWANDRLIPDILRSLEKSQPVVIRNPLSIRPWQHVLEPLSGYLILAEHLYNEGQIFAEAWNFGPKEEDSRSVQWVVEHMVQSWGNNSSWHLDAGLHPHEANYLKLDISKAKERLNWQPRWGLATAISKVVDWHQQWVAKANVHAYCIRQINDFENINS